MNKIPSEWFVDNPEVGVYRIIDLDGVYGIAVSGNLDIPWDLFIDWLSKMNIYLEKKSGNA